MSRMRGLGQEAGQTAAEFLGVLGSITLIVAKGRRWGWAMRERGRRWTTSGCTGSPGTGSSTWGSGAARGRRIVEATIAPGHRAPERVAPQLDLLRTAEAREGERA